MKIEDFVYGDEEINEKVLIELINSPSVQRLKEVSQFGMPREYYHIDGFSRYEHSIGVLILLRRLKAGIEEQIAGLLHDVSHTAFSHVVDWAIGDPTKEDFQDKNHLSFIEKSELKVILEKYGFDCRKVAEIEGFSLLEQDAPAVCADRFDYTVREMRLFKDKNVNKIVKSAVNFNGKMVFDSLEAAELFAFGYSKCQREHWAGEQARGRYYILANVLREAINQKIICLEDLYKNEREILDILHSKGNKEILGGLNALRQGFKVVDSKEEGSVIIKKKFRYVDPDVLVGGKLKRVSELSEEYRKDLELQKAASNVLREVKIIY